MAQDNRSGSSPPPPLAVVCAILIVSLVSVLVIDHPTILQAQITDKNNQISQVRAQIENLTSQLSSVPNVQTYESQITALNAEIANYTGQLDSAQSVLTLNSTQMLISSKAFIVTNSTNIFDTSLPYPEYVPILETSSSKTTWVQMKHSVFEVNFNQNVTLETMGSVAFPVLPATVEINMGDNVQSGGNTIVTAIYHY